MKFKVEDMACSCMKSWKVNRRDPTCAYCTAHATAYATHAQSRRFHDIARLHMSVQIMMLCTQRDTVCNRGSPQIENGVPKKKRYQIFPHRNMIYLRSHVCTKTLSVWLCTNF